MKTGEFTLRIRQLRDDITVEAFGGFGQSNREASMCLAHLDEAELWLIRYGIEHGSHLLVDKAKYVENLEATKGREPNV